MKKQKEVHIANPLKANKKVSTIKLSDIAEKKPVSTIPSAEKLAEFKKREQEELKALEEYSYKAEVEPPMPLEQWNQMIEEAEKEVSKEVDGFNEDEVKYDVQESKPIEEVDENNDGIDDNTGKPITGIVPTKGTFAEAEALQKKKSLSYIMRERNQQVKKEHQEE